MIISASYRSDIPAFHGDWFLRVLEAGEVSVRNPYNQKPTRIDLTPDAVDGYVFWTRNARPFLHALEQVAAQEKPFVVQYTIIGYPSAIDANVIATDLAIDNARVIAKRYGPRVVVWRYDPILLTPETNLAWHRENFARLCDALAGVTDEVVVSFAQIYAKSARNMSKAGLTWRVPELSEQAQLIAERQTEAAARGIALSLCTQPALMELSSATGARCIDAARLADIADWSLFGPQKGQGKSMSAKRNRTGCLCAESRDIGAYNSCVHGCAYCYAVENHALAKQRMQEKRQGHRTAV